MLEWKRKHKGDRFEFCLEDDNDEEKVFGSVVVIEDICTGDITVIAECEKIGYKYVEEHSDKYILKIMVSNLKKFIKEEIEKVDEQINKNKKRDDSMAGNTKNTETENTATENTDFKQKIKALRIAVEKSVEMLKNLETTGTESDATRSLWIVHETWSGKEYRDIESILREKGHKSSFDILLEKRKAGK